MARARCLVMQRDQTTMLRAWLRYHALLFGFENLTILDNGSTDAQTAALLQLAEGAGASVARHLQGAADFANRHAHFANLIGMWDTAELDYDLAIPLECDEFLAVHTEDGISCRGDSIQDAIDAARPSARSLAAAPGLVNVEARSNEFAVIALDRVFHARGADDRSDEPAETPLTCLCFGPRATVIGEARVITQGLAKRLDALGISDERFGSPPTTPRGGAHDAVWVRVAAGEPAARFRGSAYKAANPDVAASGWRPLLHFAQAGSREGRPLA